MNTKCLTCVFSIVILALMLTACSVESPNLRVYSPSVSDAMATATVSAAQVTRANSELDLRIRETAAAQETEKHQTMIQTTATAIALSAKLTQDQAEVERQAILERGNAEAEAIKARGLAEVETLRAKSQAEARTELATGEAKSWAIVALGIGLSGVAMLGALAFVIWVTGRSVATAYNDILKAQYVQISVEPRTLLPPPLVITRDGYLIDTRSGERARLRDAASVDRLRLVATTQSTNIALLARVAQDIGRTNHGKQSGGTQAADILPGIGASVPLLEIGMDHGRDPARG